MRKHYHYYICIEEGRLYNNKGIEIYVINAKLLKILLERYCIACQNIHDSYDQNPCKECKEGHNMFSLHEDFKERW
jgi:hypothetical protein